VGVLGCADIALRRFLPAAALSGRVHLAAIASRDRTRAEDVAGRYACRAMDYEELLRSDGVELVYLPLPNHLHEAWVVAALEHGKHVICEKPLGLSLASVERMLSAAARNGRLLFENLMYLQHPQHAIIKSILAAGRIGTVTGLHCEFTFPGPAPGTFRLDPRQGGGAFHDLNRYPLSAADYFLQGSIADMVRCDADWRDGMIMALAVEARTTEDERFSFTIAFGRPYRSFYEIMGTGGWLRLERAFTPPADHPCHLEIHGNGSVETLYLPAHDHFLLTIDHVAGLITDGSDFSTEHQRWRRLAQAAELCQTQARRSR